MIIISESPRPQDVVCFGGWGWLALRDMGAGQGRGFSESEPSPRWAHFSAAVGDQLYVWGGRTKDFSKEKNVLDLSRAGLMVEEQV